ncbi:glycosyltransferase family 4 protein [Dehalococcoidia bacterium]|nr:glycosyltransferase family 4 protein [Dehalococcoidia bacterium]
MDEKGVWCKMKLLFTQDTDWLRRNPAQQHHLAEMLSLRGHEVRVIDYELLWRTQGRKELYSRRAVFNNVSKIHKGANIMVVRPGIIKVSLLDYVSLLFSHKREIERQIKEFSPDVVVGWGILSSYLAIKAAKENNIPFLYYWIDVLHRLIPFKPFQPIGKMIESRVLKQADRVLAINEKLREYVTKLGAQPERTQVLRAGINLERFKVNINRDAVRKQYGLKEEDIILFFMGWLYNFSGLKEAASQLSQIQNHKIKLVIVGDGDAYEELQQIRDKYNLQDKLILTGKKAYHEIPAFIAASDICLLPAYPGEKIMHDIVPIKMYEYMAMKKPVISTTLPGVMKEFGQDNGVVYVDSPQDVVTKALELIQNGSLEELGSKARSFVERNSWDNITDEFEKILEEVIKEKRT